MSTESTSVEQRLPIAAGRRAIAAVIGIVALSDLSVYHAQGYFGPALFLPVACLLLLLGQGFVRVSLAMIISGVMLTLIAVKLAWSGSALAMFVGLWLLNAFAMTMHGSTPYLLESIVFVASTIPGGYEFLRSVQLRWRKTVLEPVDRGETSPALNYMLPIICVLMFGTIFVLANPDLISRVSTILGDVFGRLQSWVLRFSAGEIIFWCGTAWLAAGMLSPLAMKVLEGLELTHQNDVDTTDSSPMFVPFRNTLISLICLFVVYLVFEFLTLWFRKFPPGFHYSGYAHQGAAWLTAALALTTVILSMMFRGTMMLHAKVGQLRRLAWIWSGLNFLLAASAYNRLLIYVDFNGMTRMRVIGFLGTSAVVGGFVLVLWKIARGHSFPWLIRHQLLLPVLAVYLYATLPVDSLVHQYNVRRILDGHPEPCVQISEHPIDDAALSVLIPLLECKDPIIRDGVRSMLISRLGKLESKYASQVKSHWTARQLGIDAAVSALTKQRANLVRSEDTQPARDRFRTYAMQWW